MELMEEVDKVDNVNKVDNLKLFFPNTRTLPDDTPVVAGTIHYGTGSHATNPTIDHKVDKVFKSFINDLRIGVFFHHFTR